MTLTYLFKVNFRRIYSRQTADTKTLTDVITAMKQYSFVLNTVLSLVSFEKMLEKDEFIPAMLKIVLKDGLKPTYPKSFPHDTIFEY